MKECVTILIKRSLIILIIMFIIRCAFSFNEIITKPTIYGIWGYASESISFTMFIMLWYEKWLWRIDPSIKIPKLSKKYKGKLISSYDNKVRECELEIKQTLLSLHIFMISDESRSAACCATLKNDDGIYKLIYTYLNKPKATVRERSEIHYGTAMLNIDSKKTLEGSYFTDRKTIGEMSLKAYK